MRLVARFVTVLALALLSTPVAAAALPTEAPHEAPGAAARLRVERVINGSGADVPFEAFDAFHPMLTDLDEDGRDEFVAMNDNARAYVVDAAAGRVLAELATRHAGDRTDWHAQQLAGVAVADVTGNGARDLVVTNAGGHVTVLEREAREDAWTYRVAWDAFVSAPAHDAGFWAAHPWLDRDAYDPATRDFLVHGPAFVADPEPEKPGAWVFVSSDDYPGHFAFDATGRLAWLTTAWDGHAGPWVTDVDADGALDAVFATDNGHVVAYDARTGRVAWRFDARAHGAIPGSVSVPPLVADLNGDALKEVFFAARVAVENASDPSWMTRQHARYFLLDANGTERWNASYPWGHPLVHMTPVPFDVDRDGHLDLVVLDWNTIGHKPGNWERLGPANLFAVNGRDGSVMWRSPVNASFTRWNVPVADYAPDVPGLETLVEQRIGRDGGLAIVSLVNGTFLDWHPLPEPFTRANVTRGPVTGDVDGDGRLDVVVPVHRALPDGACAPKRDVACRSGALVVFSTRAPADSLWFSGGPVNDAARDPFPSVEDAQRVNAATEDALTPRGPVASTPPPPALSADAPPPPRDSSGRLPAARAEGPPPSGASGDAAPEGARVTPAGSAVAAGAAVALAARGVTRRRAPCTRRTTRPRGSRPPGTTSRT